LTNGGKIEPANRKRGLDLTQYLDFGYGVDAHLLALSCFAVSCLGDDLLVIFQAVD